MAKELFKTDGMTNEDKRQYLEQLLKENQELKNEAHSLKKTLDEMHTSPFALLATVPDFTFQVKIAFPPRPDPRDRVAGINYINKIAVFNVTGGNTIHSYPDIQGKQKGILIPYHYLESVSERNQNRKRGLVLWDSTNETRESAQVRGLRNFLAWIADIDMNFHNRIGDWRNAKGADAVPSIERLKEHPDFQYEFRMFGFRDKAKRELTNLENRRVA